MRFTGVYTGKAGPEAVLARLADVPAWDWLDGRVQATADGCRLQVDAPIPITLRVELGSRDDGLAIRLVEGDLTELAGDLKVEKYRRGSRIRVTLDLAFPVSVPGTLLRELDQRVLPRWFQALADGASVA